MSKYFFKADESDSGTRLDSYLSGMFDSYSRTKIQSLIKSGASSK